MNSPVSLFLPFSLKSNEVSKISKKDTDASHCLSGNQSAPLNIFPMQRESSGKVNKSQLETN